MRPLFGALLGLLLICGVLPAVGFAQDSPTLGKQHVTDLAAILGQNEARMFEADLVAHERKTGVKIGVLSVQTIGSKSIERFAMDAGRAWGEGKRRDRILLVYTLTSDESFNRRQAYVWVEDGLDGMINAKQMAERIKNLVLHRYDNDGSDTWIPSILNEAMAATAHIVPGKPIEQSPARHHRFWVPLLFMLGVLGGFFSVKGRKDVGLPRLRIAVATPAFVAIPAGIWVALEHEQVPWLVISGPFFEWVVPGLWLCGAIVGLFAGILHGRTPEKAHTMLAVFAIIVAGAPWINVFFFQVPVRTTGDIVIMVFLSVMCAAGISGSLNRESRSRVAVGRSR